MRSLARLCYQHRFVVIGIWVGALLLLAATSQVMRTSYDNTLTLPGTSSARAQQLLHRSVPTQAGDSDQIVWQVDRGSVTDPAVEQRVSTMLSRVSHLPQVVSVTSPYRPGNRVQISADRRTAYATVNFAQDAHNLDTSDINRVVDVVMAAREPGLTVQIGGNAVAEAEQTPLSGTSLIGIGAAAVILLLAFGSLFAMATPIVTAMAGVGSGLLLMAPLSHLIPVNGIAPILGALIGLGVGVDYALFIVTRHRRGLESGLDPEQSAVDALNTSGRAVLFAGGTVCVALLGLLSVGLRFIDALAVPAAITVVCTVLAAVTLLPALLGVLGQRVLSRRQRRRTRAEEPERARRGSGAWANWSSRVARFPGVFVAAGLAVMVAVSFPVLHLRLGASDLSNDPPSSHSYQAYKALEDGFGPGFNGPLLLVSQAGSPADRAALHRLDREIAGLPGVAAVHTEPADAGSSAAAQVQVQVTQVVPTTSPQAEATSDLITRLRDTVIPRYTHGTTLRVDVGGLTATYADLATVTSAKLPWMLATIVGFSFLLLMLAFRSLLIPAVTALLNLVSAAASFGILTAFFEWGWGTTAFGLGSAGPIEAYLPEMVLAVLFGLSMDYQVFLVSRMAEEWSRTRDNDRAVRIGQAETARVITAAAAIMIAVFIAFVFMGQRSVAEFGVGLAAAVALDAFILRTMVVPAVMHLCGPANWWLPRWLDHRLPHLAIEPPQEQQPDPESVLDLVLPNR